MKNFIFFILLKYLFFVSHIIILIYHLNREVIMYNTKVKMLRKNIGLSQYDVADELKVSQGTVSNWENSDDLPISYIKYLCQKANIPLSEFFKDGYTVEMQDEHLRDLFLSISVLEKRKRDILIELIEKILDYFLHKL